MPSYRTLLAFAGVSLHLLAACERRPDGTMGLPSQPITSVESTADEAPVALNAVSPVQYPRALLEQGIEGRVLLRLYVDSTGRLLSDSTRIAESSGYPALDTAALTGAPALRFSPALLRGRPVAAPFLQPVQFRNPNVRAASP
jgi:periplasmic protein TonB